MIKYTLLVLSSLCIFNLAVYANPISSRSNANEYKEESGLGIGAIIGGLLGGPPGAILGAAGGAWLGNKEQQEDEKLFTLEQRLLEKNGELNTLRGEFSHLQGSFGQQLQKVKMEKHIGALEQLSRGVSLVVYFRTGSAEVDKDNLKRLQHLATFVKDFPEIQIQLSAHADKRGDEKYNFELSKQRALLVAEKLREAGLDGQRIHSHAYGESAAIASEADREAYVFDRRVNIQLTLDTEI
ncbi:MAG: OmpA family protein [Gammaproteobacteria bacterium]|nr:OmpA family protein [Gammaproteobacteria bacterium]